MNIKERKVRLIEEKRQARAKGNIITTPRHPIIGSRWAEPKDPITAVRAADSVVEVAMHTSEWSRHSRDIEHVREQCGDPEAVTDFATHLVEEDLLGCGIAELGIEFTVGHFNGKLRTTTMCDTKNRKNLFWRRFRAESGD